MTDDEFARYEERIAPHREAFQRKQLELEAECAAKVAASGRGIRTSGRYWALGAALAGYVAQSHIDALDRELVKLNEKYAEIAARIEREVFGDP